VKCIHHTAAQQQSASTPPLLLPRSTLQQEPTRSSVSFLHCRTLCPCLDLDLASRHLCLHGNKTDCRAGGFIILDWINRGEEARRVLESWLRGRTVSLSLDLLASFSLTTPSSHTHHRMRDIFLPLPFPLTPQR
jgi:hypothetical protein